MRREMEYVYAVYREKSFSRAAQKLYVSQPALSVAVRKVEQELGAPVFDRSTSPVSLTEAGEFYIRSLEKILATEAEVKAYFDALSAGRTGGVFIGSSSFFCVYVLPEIVEAFGEERPGITVTLMEGGATDLSEKLKSGETDLVLEIEDLRDRAFRNSAWAEETILIAVPARFQINSRLRDVRLTFGEVREGCHLERNRRGADLALFADEPFLLLRKGNDLHRRAGTLCEKHGFAPRAVMLLDQLMSCYLLVREGKGVAFIRDSITKYVEETDKVYFYKIDDALTNRTIRLFHRKSPPLTPAARLFFDFMMRRSEEER